MKIIQIYNIFCNKQLTLTQRLLKLRMYSVILLVVTL